MVNETDVPSFIAKILQIEDIYMSFYNEANNNNLKPFAKEQDKESYTCALQGNEIYRLVPPAFR